MPRLTPDGAGRGCFMLCLAVCGPSAGRFAVREYRDSYKGIKLRDGPVNGLYGSFVFWPFPLPCWTWAQKCRLRAIGRRTSGAELLEDIEGHGQKKTRPRLPQGGRW